MDGKLQQQNEIAIDEWLGGFGGRRDSVVVEDVRRSFEGKALLRVRVTTAHDSYERLVEVDCLPTRSRATRGRSEQTSLPKTLEDPFSVGLDRVELLVAARNDEGVAEFSRFYLERLAQEARGASTDERKKQKLIDDFTPRFQFELVGLQGVVRREVASTVSYSFDKSPAYRSTIKVVPSTGKIEEEPEQGICSVTQRSIPAGCLERCEASGAIALRHLLVDCRREFVTADAPGSV